jgi:predicted amidohydrolase
MKGREGWMKLGIVQFFPIFGSVARNIAKAISLVRPHRADLWVLPELFATGYLFRDRAELAHLAEGRNGPTVTTLAQKAAEFGCFFCGGLPERGDDGALYNSACLVGPQGLVGLYRKVHLFGREKELFAPGDLGFPVFNVADAHVGMMVCFDWYFPEAARSLALTGAQVILHPANLVLPHCPEAMKTRAVENRVFTATANRIGTEMRSSELSLSFIGRSSVYGPDGRLLAQASEKDEEVLLVELDPTAASNKNITPENHAFNDRRVDQYRLD